MGAPRPPSPETGFAADLVCRVDLRDGTNVLQPTAHPGVTGLAVPGPALARPRDWTLVDRWHAAQAVIDALALAETRAPESITQRLGVAWEGLKSSLLGMVLTGLGVIAGSTALGAAIGGALGALAGGVGAAPGAVLGGQAGFDVSVALLTWLGLGFLVVEIASDLAQIGRLAMRGAERAAGSVLLESHRHGAALSTAADDFADAAALFVMALLKGVVAWLMKRPAVASLSRASATVRGTSGAIARGEATLAAEAAVADLVALLRRSRLSAGFADWVAQNWRALIDNPKLQAGAAEGGATAVRTEAAVTPSQMKAQLEPASPVAEPASTPKPMPGTRLPNADKAVINPRKVTDYALNPEHPVGGGKARVFKSALGYTQENSAELIAQLRQGVTENAAVAGKVDAFGSRFTVDIPVQGPAGSAVVRTGWIYKIGSEIPELTTLFVH